MNNINQIFASLATRRTIHTSMIACLYTASGWPSSCAPMLRLPSPETGAIFDTGFPEHLATALELNPAVHDGAVMIGRDDATAPFRITGWSYRLFPPSTVAKQEANRGSAFNSCLAMSTVAAVDRLFLVTGDTAYRFVNGHVGRL
jgi:hypothetical protein